jgi:2'-5' RNA ligase
VRLFAAIEVGDDVRAAATVARHAIEARLSPIHEHAPRIVWVKPEALHLTLRFFGEQPDEHVPGIASAIERPFDVPPFAVEWRGLGAFPSQRQPRALWIGITMGADGLGRLEAEIARRFDRLADVSEPARPFHPHLTLGRIKVPGRPLDWPEILEEAQVKAVRSTVNSVTLYRSRGLPGGAGYEALAKGWLNGSP